jgi:uncharacterized RDD family membrane protein YckC
MDQPHTPVYAGFWMRFLAYIIDAFLLGFVNFIIFIPVLGLVGITAASGAANQDLDSGTAGLLVAVMGTMFLSIIAVVVVGWLYFALMESSSKQGTLGKMALNLQVTDLEGRKLTFGRATGRYFGKIVSGAIMGIGYIMAGFTQQKQALHDIMAGCLVVRK